MKEEYYRLKFKGENLSLKTKALIERAIRENGGRITLQHDEDDQVVYPSAITFYGKRDIYFISVTDVYLDTEGNICIDGISEETADDFTGLHIEGQYLAEILYFIGYVLGWSGESGQQPARDSIHSNIMEIACEPAEKEMVDTLGRLPEGFKKKGGGYKDYYRAVFDPLYDKYYNRMADLADFEPVQS